MRHKYFRILILVCFVCFLLSCQLLSKSETPTPIYVVVTAQEPTNTPIPMKTQAPEPESAEGSIVFEDDFSSVQNNWLIGEIPGEYADVDYQIINGRYEWTVKSHKLANQRVWPDIPLLSDFTVTVDARQKSNNPDDCDYGILYRDPTNQSFLTFKLSNNYFTVNSYSEAEDWIEIIPWTDSNAIAQGDINKMKVTKSNDEYVFYVNDQQLTKITYTKMKEGQLGLDVDVFPPDTTCVFEFDNFIVTSP